MSRKLILIHGRSQANKDPDALKHDWVSSLERGLAETGLTLDLDETDIVFPYYGDTLAQLVSDPQANDVVEVLLRGEGDESPEIALQRELLSEMLESQGIDQQALEGEVDAEVIERGPFDWRWLHAGLKLLDAIDGVNSAGVALATNDVSKYLTNPGVRRRLNRGILRAFDQFGPGDEIIVIAHSLGTVVAYDLLLEQATQHGWRVTDFITIGSPLGMTAVHKKYKPLRHPDGVGPWFNAFDERDIVALYPLDEERFGVQPAISNHHAVENDTFNHHGIIGYLDDPILAAHIHDALTRTVSS